ncbi:30S ribosomal protein S16 [Patescibacteria group bacterium]|nr:30S ribosomal protein S16 [Patescibacteria group bacterium]
MLKIRLQRVGRTHEPSFRLVVTESQNAAKSGKSLEVLGSYDARRGDKSTFKADRVTYWISKGAQVSGTVHNLLVSKNIISGKKVNVLPLKKAIVKDAPVGEAVEATPEEKPEAKPATAPEKAEEKAEEKIEVETPVETPSPAPATEEVPA